MVECIKSDIIELETKKDRHVIIETLSGKTYDGSIKNRDCLGVLFVPKDKLLNSKYLYYKNIEAIEFPDRKD